jgi:DNA-binding response OmpR family regulator
MNRNAPGVVADPLGDCRPATGVTEVDGDALAAGLSPQERAVFTVLWAHRNRVVSRCEICRCAQLMELSDRRCDALIAAVRRHLGPERIRTVRRRGWMLVA